MEQNQYEIMRNLAKDAAVQAAEHVSDKTKQELRKEIIDMRNEMKKDIEKNSIETQKNVIETISNQLAIYYGDMTPADHTVEHARLSKWLDLMDNFWTSVVINAAKWMFILFFSGYFLIDYFKGI